MNLIKFVELISIWNVAEKTYLSYYDYHTVMILTSMQFSAYDEWQQSHVC